jgi:hypothetical protein
VDIISSKDSSAEMYFLQKYLPRVSFDLHSCLLGLKIVKMAAARVSRNS